MLPLQLYLSNVFSRVLNLAIGSITSLLAGTLAYREVAFPNKHIHWYSYLDGERHYKNFQRTQRSDLIQIQPWPFPDAFSRRFSQKIIECG